MKPTKHYVLVIESVKESTTASGLILTGAAEKGSQAGEVLAIGPHVEDIKIGDKVALGWDKGLRILHDGKKAVLIAEEYILGVY